MKLFSGTSQAYRLILFPAALLALSLALSVHAETPIESSAETRFQLDLHVPDDVLKNYLPPGWSLSVATAGNAKDANIRLIFVDRMTVNGPDGKPVGAGSQRLVYLESPVKDASGEAARLVIGGITASAADAPGPFGNFLPATAHSMQRAVSGSGGTVIETQDWMFRAAGGEQVEMHIQFERTANTRNPISDTKFYSAKDPATMQISRQEQVLSVLRNATTNPPDKVKEFSLKVSGGSFAKLFDGTQKMLSWDHILWVNRTVLKP
jgi:hypothetical protein